MSNNNNFKDKISRSYEASTQLDAAIRSIVILGENTDVDNTGVPYTLWDYGPTQALYNFPTAASTASIVSSDANDTFTNGSGARIVLIEGLDINYREQWEVVNLNGTTPAVSTNSYFRVNALRVVFSGTGKKNAGIISCTVDSKIVRYINTGESLDHTAVYTVPLGHTFFIESSSFGNIKAGSSVYTAIATNVFVPSTNTLFQSSVIAVDGSQVINNGNSDTVPRIDEKSDIYYNIEFASTTNLQVSASIRGLLIHNSWIPKYRIEKND